MSSRVRQLRPWKLAKSSLPMSISLLCYWLLFVVVYWIGWFDDSTHIGYLPAIYIWNRGCWHPRAKSDQTCSQHEQDVLNCWECVWFFHMLLFLKQILLGLVQKLQWSQPPQLWHPQLAADVHPKLSEPSTQLQSTPLNILSQNAQLVPNGSSSPWLHSCSDINKLHEPERYFPVKTNLFCKSTQSHRSRNQMCSLCSTP